MLYEIKFVIWRADYYQEGIKSSLNCVERAVAFGRALFWKHKNQVVINKIN